MQSKQSGRVDAAGTTLKLINITKLNTSNYHTKQTF